MRPAGGFGIQLPAAATAAQAGAIGRLAEASGVATVWAPDIRRDPFVAAAAVSSQTQRVGVGTAVAVAFARSPTVTATTAWDLQIWSEGRFTLGLGSQVPSLLRDRFGVEADRPAERMADYVLAVRDCWRAFQRGYGGHRGSFYSLRRPSLQAGPDPAQVEPPKIFIAAVNPVMARVCGRVGDGLLVHPFCTPTYLEEILIPALRRGAQEAEREPPRVVLQLVVASSREEAAMQMVPYATPAYRRVSEHAGHPDLVGRVAEAAGRGRLREAAAAIAESALDGLGAIVATDPAALAAALKGRFTHADQISLGTPWFGPPAAQQLERSLLLAEWLGALPDGGGEQV